MAATVVLDKEEDQYYVNIGVVMATKWRQYLFYLQPHFLAVGEIFPKSWELFTAARISVYCKYIVAAVHVPKMKLRDINETSLSSAFTIKILDQADSVFTGRIF